eukprot:g1816.t1
MFSARSEPSAGKAQLGEAAAGAGGWMSNVFSRVRVKMGEAISPRVVQPSETSAGRSWASSSGVIRTSELTHFERISLNAMEERVLPPDVRIKIVCAQASAVEQEEELLEAEVNRLDGLVRTLALYGVLERNAIDGSKSDKLAPERERDLGKMLVAAVQLELFRMLDDICEAGDMENELFDDLCTDAIQDGRRAGFISLTADLLLSPGSGYKRLLQIRKDQIVEEIADVAGLRALGAHDCQRDSSESPKSGSRQQVAPVDSDIGSPGSAAGGPGLKLARSARSVSETLNLSGLDPSPSSQMPDSRSPSPENGHRRSATQRVRDLLSSIDGLVMESEQPEAALNRLPQLSPSNNPPENGGGGGTASRGRSVRGYKRQSTGAIDPRSSRSSRLSLRTPPPPGSAANGGDEGDQPSPSHRAFFPNERDWRGSPFGATPPPPELAGRRASVIPDPGAEEGDEPASADMLLAEVDWLIAGTNAALGKKEGGSTTDGQDSLESTPDKSDPSPPSRGDGDDDDAPQSADAALAAANGDGDGDGDGGRGNTELVDPIGHGGLEVTPDKRELSPKRHDDAPETVGAMQVAGGRDEEGMGLFGRSEEGGDKHKRVGGGGSSAGDGQGADSPRTGAPLPSPGASLTASPSPEARGSSSSPTVTSDAESLGDDGAKEEEEDGSEAAAVSLSSGTPVVEAASVGSLDGAGEGGEESDSSSATPPTAVDTRVEIREGEESASLVPTASEDVDEEEEEEEQPVVDAVVASGFSASDWPTDTGNGDARSPLEPKEETAELDGDAAEPEDGERDSPPTGAVRRTSASDVDDSTAGGATVQEAASGGGLPPLAGVPDALEEAVSPELIKRAGSPVLSGVDVPSAVFVGDSSGPEKDLGGSRGEAVVVVDDGAGVEREAEASAFEEFIEELFKPQDTYGEKATKEVFYKLAHSSIMRLNESSMNKLFDLITMGLKYQALSCAQPQQLLQVTLHHLETVKKMVPNLANRIDTVTEISLFLQYRVQLSDGTLVLDAAGKLPVGAEAPGIIRYLGSEGSDTAVTSLPMAAADNVHGSLTTYIDFDSPMGTNIYEPSPNSALDPGAVGLKTPATEAAAAAVAEAARRKPGRSFTKDKRESKDGGGAISATAGLNLLATLLGAPAKDDAEHEEGDEGAGGAKRRGSRGDSFKINLFPDDPFDAAQAKGDDEGDGSIITIDLASSHTGCAKMLRELDLSDDNEDAGKGVDSRRRAAGGGGIDGRGGAKGGADADEDGLDDLLDLMDSAESK